jgi:S-DNA-T family DNA segregation ATPase FtsK/SpoIIIE
MKATDEKGEDEDEMVDERYDDAVALVAEARQASISMIQRRLRIGYNRAARIIEKMEQEGIVGPSDGTSKPREVFINKL